MADEEDVALSAFDSFCRDTGRGLFPRLNDRDDLWRLLLLLTAQKALELRRHEHAQKRDAARTAGEEALERIAGPEPSPAFAAQVAEECRRLLALLPDEPLRNLAVWKMEGYENEEIAARLGCAVRTVERRLRVIRSLWGEEGGR
jgi:DNA-directed RNA polymerase specialized sigma24 family protein